MNGYYPPNWCFHHEEEHSPMDWRDGCQSPEDVEFADQYGRFEQAWEDGAGTVEHTRSRWWRIPLARWVKQVLVCWWAHRTRRVGDGTYLSTGCWACTGHG